MLLMRQMKMLAISAVDVLRFFVSRRHHSTAHRSPTLSTRTNSSCITGSWLLPVTIFVLVFLRCFIVHSAANPTAKPTASSSDQFCSLGSSSCLLHSSPCSTPSLSVSLQSLAILAGNFGVHFEKCFQLRNQLRFR